MKHEEPCRAVVVEDDEDSAEMMALMLRTHGHAVEVHSDPHRALVSILASPPDVALLDLSLPGLDGLELARRIREELRARAPTLIAVTGWASEGDRARSLAAGFDRHLVKPVDVDDVVRAVRDACADAAE